MRYCMVTFFSIQIDRPFYRNHLGLYRNFHVIFKHACSFSQHSVFFPRLIYRCFITLFSTSIFDCNFETFCSCKFASCVLKSEYIYYLFDLILTLVIYLSEHALPPTPEGLKFIKYYEYNSISHSKTGF